MYGSTKVELKKAPEVKQVVLAAFPSYRKHNAYLRAFPSEVNINSYWDGGSRSEFAIVELATGKRRNLPTSSHPYFDVARYGVQGENQVLRIDSAGGVYLKELPEGFALVEAGTFCGKPSTATVYVPEANLTKLLASVSAE